VKCVLAFNTPQKSVATALKLIRGGLLCYLIESQNVSEPTAKSWTFIAEETMV